MTTDEKIDHVLEILNAIQITLRHHTELHMSQAAAIAGINTNITQINARLDAQFRRVEDLENRIDRIDRRG